MHWFNKDSLGRVFSSKNSLRAGSDDPAHMLLTRNELEAFSHPATHTDDDRFVSARRFLTALKIAAEGSSLDHMLGSTPQDVRTAARLSLMNAAEEGKCPFFHDSNNHDKQIRAEDMYVPVAFLAKHALTLMDNTRSATLPGIYLSALKATEEHMRSRSVLADSWHMTYEQGGSLELGTARTGSCPLETVLQPRKNDGSRPS